MKSRQIITTVLEYVDSDHSYRFDDEMCCSEVSKMLDKIANQRVIEELEKVYHNSDYATNIALHHRLQELKQD